MVGAGAFSGNRAFPQAAQQVVQERNRQGDSKVGRSTKPTGPYTDRNGTAMTSGGGTQVLAGHGSIHGPGGEGAFTDTDIDILDYHYDADSWPHVS